MSSRLEANPFRCRMWDVHQRLPEYITEANCREEIASFIQHGQVLPVLGRPVKADRDFDFELIYGARRLFIARHLNKPLILEVREMSDRDALIAMDIENRQRRAVSPYERGVSYAAWLRAGHFNSQDELARALQISASQVSRLLQIARLPAVILDAFDSPTDIRENWGLDILKLLEDGALRIAVLGVARTIGRSRPRPNSGDVYRRITSASGPAPQSARHATLKRSLDEVIRDSNGDALFRIRYQNRSVALVLPRRRICSKSFRTIKIALSDILQHANPQVPDNTEESAHEVEVVGQVVSRV